jgi:alkaline phosphatase
MAREEPLLARPTSEHSSEREYEEEDALLTGERTDGPSGSAAAHQRWREIGLFVWALIATIVVVVLAVVVQHEQSVSHSRKGMSGGWGKIGKPTGKRNMIFMVSDGMGPTSLSLTRSYRQFESGLPFNNTLVLDKHLIGSSRTRSTSSLVTDSAAGATAFGCGKKSYNGAIAVLPDHSPCGTVLEAAKKAGYMTGLVVTTRITDATPACFAAHANRREYEDLIAEHEVGNYPLGRTVDLILGGGRCHFLPNTTEGSCREDGKDVVAMAKKNGFSYIDNRAAFDNLGSGSAVKLPLLGLFALLDIPYEIDRVHAPELHPSQAEMTRVALQALSAATKHSDKGFFIMIEGSRIDHTGHANDPAAQVHEVLAHDEAFAAVLDFIEHDDTEAILVGTSDHETGGLATAVQLSDEYPHYYWFPEALAKASHSAEYLQAAWYHWLREGEGADANLLVKRRYLRDLIRDGLGISHIGDEAVDAVLDANPLKPPAYLFAKLISDEAQVGWTTHGHTGKHCYPFSPYSTLFYPIILFPSNPTLPLPLPLLLITTLTLFLFSLLPHSCRRQHLRLIPRPRPAPRRQPRKHRYRRLYRRVSRSRS